MARTIIVANQKGGVGKTTTVHNLGAALARLGKKTAMIDMDPQGALTVSAGLDPYTTRPSTFEILLGRTTPLSSAMNPIDDNLFLVPANAELIASEYKLVREKDRTTRLRSAIRSAISGIDIFLVDTPPSLGLLTINALVAGNELLIPVATDYLAMRGVRALLEAVWMIHGKVNPRLELLALVPTMHRSNSPPADAVVAEMRKVFKQRVSQTVIPLDEAAASAPAARKSVLDYAPESRAAQAYRSLAEEVLHG